MKHNNIPYLLLTTVFITTMLLGCSTQKLQRKAKKTKVKLVKVVRARVGRIAERLETTGDVIAINAITLRATVEGPISFCPWREGDQIKALGEKLIEINRPLYRQQVASSEAALNVAKAKLADLKAGTRPEEIARSKESVIQFKDCTNFAKVDLERVKSLVKSGSVAAESVEKARVNYVKCHTQLSAARELLSMLEAGPTKTEIAIAIATVAEAAAKHAQAQAKLDECKITASITGIITEVLVREGDLATPRAALLKMMDPTSLIVRAGLPERVAGSIQLGTKTTVRLDAYPGKTFKAIINRIHPRIERRSRTRIIEARIIDKVKLLPHLFARLVLDGRIVSDAIIVPDAAILSTPRGQKIVFIVEQGKAQKRIVEIGLEDRDQVQITKGIKAGELVIVQGNLNLKTGTKVRSKFLSSPKNTAVKHLGETK